VSGAFDTPIRHGQLVHARIARLMAEREALACCDIRGYFSGWARSQQTEIVLGEFD